MSKTTQCELLPQLSLTPALDTVTRAIIPFLSTLAADYIRDRKRSSTDTNIYSLSNPSLLHSLPLQTAPPKPALALLPFNPSFLTMTFLCSLTHYPHATTHRHAFTRKAALGILLVIHPPIDAMTGCHTSCKMSQSHH